MSTDPAEKSQALRITCKTCGAAPGRPCHDGAGEVLEGVHRARLACALHQGAVHIDGSSVDLAPEPIPPDS